MPTNDSSNSSSVFMPNSPSTHKSFNKRGRPKFLGRGLSIQKHKKKTKEKKAKQRAISLEAKQSAMRGL